MNSFTLNEWSLKPKSWLTKQSLHRLADRRRIATNFQIFQWKSWNRIQQQQQIKDGFMLHQSSIGNPLWFSVVDEPQP
jgi:hypothetical protein